MDVYQILRSEYFFQKCVGRFNLMATFFTFYHFCKKTYKKTYQFYDLFSHFQLLSARWQNFLVWNIFTIKLPPFLNVSNFLFISASLSNICDKTYEKTYHFFYIFWNFNIVFTTLQNFMTRKLIKRQWRLLEYVNKILLIAATLNNIFDRNCEKYCKFCQVFFNFILIFTLWCSFVMTRFL